MTNPDNIVRVRARNGGRASVYEANGWAQAYTSGLLEGNGVTQNISADMNVLVGGSATKPDVVLAINPADYKIGLDLVGQQAIAITAPASNSRISAIVAYTDDLSLATTEDTVTGSPSSCGLIVVNGTASVSPSEPTDNQIRTAITADGATGSQAAYCVIATVLVESTTTTITDSMITMKMAQIGSQNIDFATLPIESSTTYLTSTLTTTESVLATYTIPTSGTYLFLTFVRAQDWSDASNDYLVSRIFIDNDDQIASTVANPITRYGIARAIATHVLTAELNAGVSVKWGVRTASGTAKYNSNQTFVAMRIA